MINPFVDVKDSIDVVADGFKIVGQCWDFVSDVLLNPTVILTAIDQLALGIAGCLLLLKILGFDTDKWIWVTIIIKIAIMAFI